MIAARKLTFILGFLFLLSSAAAFGSAANIYITQSGSATGNCTTNVQTPTFFNDAANWGTGASQIGPGTTVLLCGTFTGAAGATEFTFQGSGNSTNSITLKFDTGALLTAPYWSANGAINCTNLSYVTVDGGTNGTIQNTANGTNLANHQTSTGFYGGGCTNSEVKNLTVKNIYVNAGSSSGASDRNGASTSDIVFNGNSTNSIIDHNRLSQAKTGVLISADPNGDANGVQIYGNTISDMDWGIAAGGGDSGDTITGLLIHDNSITDWTNWQFPTDTMHQDGMILFNFASGSQTVTARIYNNHIYGDLGVGSPTGFIFCAQNASCTMFNNLLVNTGHVIYGIIWADTHRGGDNIYNNTIIGLASDFAITLGTSTATNVSTPDVVQNNIILGPGVGIHDYSTLTSDVSVSDHNVWRTASGNAPQMATNDSSYVSYATWRADGFDAHSTNADPNLDGSYHLQLGSAAIGLGANLVSLNNSSLDLDMALQPRPGAPGSALPSGTAWDSGIYNSGSSSGSAPPTNLVATVH
jgi:hypothetical protein